MSDYELAAQKFYGGNAMPAIARDEHEPVINSKQVVIIPLSYYRQASLISGYVFHGFALPGSNPTVNDFRIMRESLENRDVLFAGGTPKFVHTWSGSSLASISYL